MSVNLDPAVEIIQRRVADLRIMYVFGSHARGDAGATSDVDLAILASTSPTELELWHLQEDIAAALSCDVDLVDLRAAPTVLRKEVIESGQLLFSVDTAETQAFEARVLGAYVRLQDERREILNDIRARGHVHD